jgi:three-Cys-motif partner protein
LKYLPPSGGGGAAFVDLFSGPGMKRLRETGVVVDGSPLIAAKHVKAPFSKIVACDIDPENVMALRERLLFYSDRAHVVEGDCNDRVQDLLSVVPRFGLNLALVDPFGLAGLKFETLRQLASVARMDLIVHFPTGDIKRNLVQHKSTEKWLDEALGTATWRNRQRDRTDVAALVAVLMERLCDLGYSKSQVKSHPSIKNDQGVPLYHLVYASKHDRGNKIWNSVLRRLPTGQTTLDLD